MSLYISYVYSYSHIEQIRCDMMNAIEKFYGLGKVSYIDLILKMDQNSRHFYQAYIHFEFWNDTEIARKWQFELNSKPEQPQILYYCIGYEVNSVRQYHWKVMKNLSKKHVSGERKLSLNIEENKEKQEISVEPTTPQKQMTNKDFSDLMNAPIKKQEKEMVESLENCSKRLDFDEDEEFNQQIDEFYNELEKENMKLVSSDYADKLENRVNYLTSEANLLYEEKMNLLEEIERLKCEIKMRDNRLSWYNLQFNKLNN